MGNIWTVTRQTIAESIRMKIAVFFVLMLVMLVLGLPFVSRGDNSVSGAVQAFLVYSIMAVTFLLSCLSIFLCRSISEDLSGKHITMLMTKPLARWQYILGKWAGICVLNFSILIVSGLVIYGLTCWIASRPPRDRWDAEQLEKQVLIARHATPFVVPDFSAEAAQQFERDLEEGKYADVLGINPAAEKNRIRQEIVSRWRTVTPFESRLFQFEDVRCSRSPEDHVHIQYEARVYGKSLDDILRCGWWFGDRSKGTRLYRIERRDVVDRKHTVTAPADCVADDNTLQVVFENINPWLEQGEPQTLNSVSFEGPRAIEALFAVSSFESNMVRALVLVWCRLAFLSAVGVLAASMFSFPVACLVALAVYALAAMHGFVNEAVQYMSGGDEVSIKVVGVASRILLKIPFLIIPNFAEVDGLSMLVDGRNVTLKWVLVGLGKMVLVQTSILLTAACLIFSRREVAQVSI